MFPFLVKYLWQEGHVVQLISAISGITLSLAALIFVDDTDILAKAPTEEEVRDRIEAAALTWSGGLRVRAEAFVPKNVFGKWYALDGKMANGSIVEDATTAPSSSVTWMDKSQKPRSLTILWQKKQ